jgi:hypothetical protein
MLLQKISRVLLGDKQVEQWALLVARRSESTVWPLVESRIAQMNDAQARGYVRARASADVRRAVDRLAHEHVDLSVERRERLFDLAIEALTIRIAEIHSVLHRPVARLRRAA